MMDCQGNAVRKCCETCYYCFYDVFRDQYNPCFCGCVDSDHDWSNVSPDDTCKYWKYNGDDKFANSFIKAFLNS